MTWEELVALDAKVWPTIETLPTDYWVFLVQKQLDEIVEEPDAVLKEMCDVWLIAHHWLRVHVPSAPDAIADRLRTRHKGHIQAIRAKYQHLYEEEHGQ